MYGSPFVVCEAYPMRCYDLLRADVTRYTS
jgi:hypothetical protein